MKTLFAGPFVGEFGWELFCWQGILRKYIEVNNFEKVIISGRNSTKFLYEDFCDEYIIYEPDVYEPDSYFNRGKMTNIPQPPKGCTYIPYNHLVTHYNPISGWSPKLKQSFIKYGKKIKTDIKVLIHARNTKGAATSTSIRNWNSNNFEKIVNHFSNIKFASIGTKSASSHIKNTIDLRDIDVKNYMNSADLIIGPSSGPIHLAALCGLNQLTWCGKPYDISNKKRYIEDWNPFNTKVEYIISNDWNPSTKQIINKMENML
jgi:hypothetical protein